MTILPFTVTMVILFFIRFEKTCIEITYFQYNHLSYELAPPPPPPKKIKSSSSPHFYGNMVPVCIKENKKLKYMYYQNRIDV